MLDIKKETKDGVCEVTMSGIVDEHSDLSGRVGAAPAVMHVRCSGIARLNSQGIKAWIQYFQTAHRSGTKVVFLECPPSIVEQLNMFSNFNCGGEVRSIELPFRCSCGNEFRQLRETRDLAPGLAVPGLPCGKCGKTASFDDSPEEYFQFLEDLR